MQKENLSELLQFIEASKTQGASDEFLGILLTRKGWPEEDVYAALGLYWEKLTGIPIPAHHRGGELSRDAFHYLLSFSTLATWAGALGSLLFGLIEHWLPDPVSTSYQLSLRTEVTWQLACIAVAFPIFVLVTRAALLEASQHPERLESGVRKWLTYIALFLTAAAMAGDLICFLYRFLTGELTLRFVLKVLTVLLICGAIFLYYLRALSWDRKTDVTAAKKWTLKLGIATGTAVIVSFCAGLGLSGGPSEQRHLEADRKRVEDLRAIGSAVHAWYWGNGLVARALPATLNQLTAKGLSRSQVVDPETGLYFEYRVTSATSYELCANFAAAEESGQSAGSLFQHGAGRTCFSLDASQQQTW